MRKENVVMLILVILAMTVLRLSMPQNEERCLKKCLFIKTGVLIDEVYMYIVNMYFQVGADVIVENASNT